MNMDNQFYDDGILIAETDNKTCASLARQNYLNYLKTLEEKNKEEQEA